MVKKLGCVLSCLCDWCTLKNMCGLSEYAQPQYFYLPLVGVVATDILSNRKASAQGSSTDLTDDDDIWIAYSCEVGPNALQSRH